MSAKLARFGFAATLALAAAAQAQPVLTALGGTPTGVSNSQAGTTYIASGGTTRWSINGPTLTATTITGTGGGRISADGAYQSASSTNGGSIVGATAGVLPAFGIPSGFAAFTLPTGGAVGARWTASTDTVVKVPGIPNDAYSQSYGVFGSGDSGNVHSVTAMSSNGRFLGLQAQIATYIYPTTPQTQSITNITCAGDVATVTCPSAHLLAPGNQVTIVGNSVAAYNGAVTVLATPSATTFTFAITCGGTGTGGNMSFAAGTRVVASNTFRFRGCIWDGNTNTMRTLPAPFRTSTQPLRRRDTTVWAISDDGLVVVGAQEHNVGAAATSLDPDGGRLVVWRWDSGISDYVMSYLPNGVDGSGFPVMQSTSLGTVHMNGAGTIIVGPGNGGICKWVWNAGTSTWDRTVIGSNLTVPASWLPFAVTSCGLPPTLSVTGMSEDGNTIVGAATYSTCGSFMRGGWIWTSGDGLITDWYDYLAAQGVVGTAPGVSSTWGPIGDGAGPDYTKGLPRVGNPTAISPDGTIFVGSQGGNQVIVGAQPWILRPAGSDCVAPAIATNPAATANFSRCNRFVNLSVAARGSGISFQWYRTNGGSPIALVEGVQASGANIIGASQAAMTIVDPKPADADTYYCVVTGACGSPAVSTSTTVQVDPAAVTPPGDTCASPEAVVGALPITKSYNPCGAWSDDVGLFPSCLVGGTSGQDVWYSYTAPSAMDLRIETCTNGFDSVVSVYDTCNGTELACNDDLNTGPTTSPTCSSTKSRIARISLAQDQTILVRVAAKYANGAVATSSSNGQVTFSVAPAASAGDSCSSPIAAVLGANPYSTIEATYDALDGAVPSCQPPSSTSRDVWFIYSPPVNGKITAGTCGSNFNTIISVRESCGSPDIACNDTSAAADCTPSGTQQGVVKNVPVLANTPYLIRVGGTSSTTFGSGNMTLSFKADPCSLADITEVGGTLETPGSPDGQLTLEDILVFIDAYNDATGCPGTPGTACNLADITETGGTAEAPGVPDGQLTLEDILVFTDTYNEGC